MIFQTFSWAPSDDRKNGKNEGTAKEDEDNRRNESSKGRSLKEDKQTTKSIQEEKESQTKICQ